MSWRQFEFLEIVKGEIRAGRVQIEAFVANLDHAYNAILLVEHGSRHQFLDGCRANLFAACSARLDLSKMLACLTLVKLLNNSTFLVTAV